METNQNLNLLTEALKALLNNEIVTFEKEIKKGKCTGYVYLPVEYAGKKCRILILNENNTNNTERRGTDILPDEVLPKS